MARHISEGTLSNDAHQLVSEGRELLGAMFSLPSETTAKEATLEDAYLLGDASYAEVQEAERQSTVLREELARWHVVVPVPSDKVPGRPSISSIERPPILKPGSPWRRRLAPFRRHPGV